MTKYDENGWIQTYGVELTVTSDFKLLVLRGQEEEIIEVSIPLLLSTNYLYLTRWEMLKAKVSWIWKIIRL